MVTSRNSFLIISHVMVYGAAHALRDYLTKKKYSRVVFMTHPLTEDVIHSELVFYKKGHKQESFKKRDAYSGSMLSYLETFGITLWWVVTKHIRTDVIIGVNNLNCFAGILLRTLGFTKRVVYYSIDFTPQRFSNPTINNLYHHLESFCVKHADVVWNTSARIAEGREEYMAISQKEFPQHVVPIGVWPAQIAPAHITKENRFKALFMGHILKKQGLQKIIDAIPRIVKKIPQFSLYVVGDGPYKKTIEQLVKKRRVVSRVTFAGWVQDRKEIDKLMSQHAIALAPYSTEGKKSDNFTYYADPTKLKDYISAGLPVITTSVPHNATAIERSGCGIVVGYSADAIADAVMYLLEDKKRLQTYQSHARRYAQTFDWNSIFTHAIKTIKI